MPSQLIDRSLKVLAKEYPSAFIRLALERVGPKEESRSSKRWVLVLPVAAARGKAS